MDSLKVLLPVLTAWTTLVRINCSASWAFTTNYTNVANIHSHLNQYMDRIVMVLLVKSVPDLWLTDSSRILPSPSLEQLQVAKSTGCDARGRGEGRSTYFSQLMVNGQNCLKGRSQQSELQVVQKILVYGQVAVWNGS